MNLPIGHDDIRLDLGPGRDRDLPTIYKTTLHPKKSGPGNIYYFIQELSKTALQKALDTENRLHIPHGTEQRAIDQGGLGSGVCL
jgi:hypothetical protein